MQMKVFTPEQKDITTASSWGEWSKEASEFLWEYDCDETCYILEGKATVTDTQGNSISFKKGDMVYFPTGLKCTWRIEEDIRKNFIFDKYPQ